MTGLTFFLRRQGRSTDFLLLFFLVGNLFFVIWTLAQYPSRDFVVDVAKVGYQMDSTPVQAATLSNTQLHGELNFSSQEVLDFIFLNKVSGMNILFALFTAFTIFQLIRIKSLWYYRKFTAKLYRNIDALSVIALVMFILSRIQERYTLARVTELTGGLHEAVTGFHFTLFSVLLIILGNLLKAFAKQGNLLQNDHDLTI